MERPALLVINIAITTKRQSNHRAVTHAATPRCVLAVQYRTDQHASRAHCGYMLIVKSSSSRFNDLIHATQRKHNMTMNNAVVWLDHTKAQVIHFDADASESEALKTHSHHPHPHQNHADTH